MPTTTWRCVLSGVCLVVLAHGCGDEGGAARVEDGGSSVVDAGPGDAGDESGFDAGVADAGPADAGEGADASTSDAGFDAGSADAGRADAGPPQLRPFGATCSRGSQCESNICSQSGICTRLCDAQRPCPDAPDWSCSERWRVCRCTPAGPDVPDNGRDEDCDGVVDSPRPTACTTAPYLLDCGACVDPRTNPLHCGACNYRCRSGQCAGGQCVSGCTTPPDDLECNGECVNKLADPDNCGACGRVCRSRQCAQGVCVPLTCTVQADCGAELDQYCLGGTCVEPAAPSLRTVSVGLVQVKNRSPASLRLAVFHGTSPDGSTVRCAQLAPGAAGQPAAYNLLLPPRTSNIAPSDAIVTAAQYDGAAERYFAVEVYGQSAGAGPVIGWGCSPAGTGSATGVTVAPWP